MSIDYYIYLQLSSIHCDKGQGKSETLSFLGAEVAQMREFQFVGSCSTITLHEPHLRRYITIPSMYSP